MHDYILNISRAYYGNFHAGENHSMIIWNKSVRLIFNYSVNFHIDSELLGELHV